MTIVVTLPAPVYHGLIENCTSRTERLMYPSRGEELPDGSIRFKLPDTIATMLQEFMLEGESYEDAIQRLMAKFLGQIS